MKAYVFHSLLHNCTTLLLVADHQRVPVLALSNKFNQFLD